jgi:hypothetical protein
MTSVTFVFLHLLSVLYITPKVSDGQQQMQHYKLLMQVLNKRHLNHIESFKKALKLHSEHVQQRQKRVGKDIKLTTEMSLTESYIVVNLNCSEYE